MNNGDDPHNPQAQNQHDFNAHYAKFVLPDLKNARQVAALVARQHSVNFAQRKGPGVEPDPLQATKGVVSEY
jgi:hypothetical protein